MGDLQEAALGQNPYGLANDGATNPKLLAQDPFRWQLDPGLPLATQDQLLKVRDDILTPPRWRKSSQRHVCLRLERLQRGKV
jgi:hypothetical protein